MLIEDQHPDNKSIMVAVLGVPNAGKSTLVNYLLGMDLSVVTHKPQTTRNKFHCILTIDRTEIILVDTPGIHKSNKEFNKRLNQQAREGSIGADINLLLIDLTRPILAQIEEIKGSLDVELARSWLVFNKSDRVENARDLPLSLVKEKARELIPNLEDAHFLISAKEGESVHTLIGHICDIAPSAPHLYNGGDVSNKNMRFFVAEYIREQAFLLLNEELPYELAVVIDDYKDLDGQTDGGIIAKIAATIIVNRPSQRAIVVGSKGSIIKEIGSKARQKIEAMVGGQIHLNLHVKVIPNWFKNNTLLEEIGLPRAVDSNRVWRSHEKSVEKNSEENSAGHTDGEGSEQVTEGKE